MAKQHHLAPSMAKWADYKEDAWLEEIRTMHFEKIRYNRWFREHFFRLPFDNLEHFFDYDNYYITPEALWNILSKHYLHDGSIQKRRFTVPFFELLQIILTAKSAQPQPVSGKKLLMRIYVNPVKMIGNKIDGSPTNRATILTNLNGQIQTVFPATSPRFKSINPNDKMLRDDDLTDNEEGLVEDLDWTSDTVQEKELVMKYRIYRRFFKSVSEPTVIMPPKKALGRI